MTLLDHVVQLLREERIEFALVGAAALAAHGVGRSTLDIDLLVTDQRVLELSAHRLREVGGVVTRGDADDPLAGVVRRHLWTRLRDS